jgi:Na+/H+ antiporter NhaD/arsenite permease-like protein
MDKLTLAVFALVYVGMILGRYPGLAMDRTGIALIGAIVLLATGRVNSHEAWEAIDVSTIALLLGLMVVSSQFRLGGFYTFVTRRIASAELRPEWLLAMVVAVMGALAALLTNDVICLAVAPVLIEGCAMRRLDPRPYLLGLACAANVGSAATLIGNPQNMLIGQALDLSFGRYMLDAGIPAALGLVIVWLVIVWLTRGRWEYESPRPNIDAPPFNLWQTGKGLVATAAIVGIFLFTPWPRDVVALAVAGVLLLSRRLASRTIMGFVDWHLLLLFMGLFVVNHELESTGLLANSVRYLRSCRLDLEHPGVLFGVTVVLSNLVSNVPATMLLLPFASHPFAGPVLALASTLAGNLFIVGSIANVIVVEQAQRFSIRISWIDHVRVGLPITAATLALAAGWLWLRSVL